MAAEFAEPILHVDMDAFFVEVERRNRPELVGVPVVVGGLGHRGVVASASYEARRRGVHSAMPTAHARRLCPGARYLPPDHRRYGAASAEVFALLGSFTPLVEGVSLDEAFLDVSGLRNHYPTPAAVGEAIRARLHHELGLPASVGIATTKLIAKLASEAAKPDGLMVVAAGEELGFLHPLPVRALWGVGEATYAALEALGVSTVGELVAIPPETLRRRLGPALGAHLHHLAGGHDPRPVTPDTAARSVSSERTFEEDLADGARIDAELLRQSDRVVGRLRRAGLAGRTVTLKVRYSDFTTVTRSLTLDSPVDVTHDVHAAIRRLAGRLDLGRRPVRLLGVGVGGLVEAAAPRQLQAGRAPAWDDLAQVVDAVRRRFGDGSLGPAAVLDESGDDHGNRRERPGG